MTSKLSFPPSHHEKACMSPLCRFGKRGAGGAPAPRHTLGRGVIGQRGGGPPGPPALPVRQGTGTPVPFCPSGRVGPSVPLPLQTPRFSLNALLISIANYHLLFGILVIDSNTRPF